MADVFLADALRMPDVLGAVLGRPVSDLRMLTASVAGYQLVLCDPVGQLTLVPQGSDGAGSDVQGVLVQGLSDRDRAAIDHYEQSFGRSAITVASQCRDSEAAPAITYVNLEGAGEAVVDPAPWCATWGGHARRMAGEIAAYRGRKTAAEITPSLYSMRTRADAWVALQRLEAEPDAEFDLSRDVVVKAFKRPYMNFFSAEEMDLQFRRFDGTMGPLVNRGCWHVGQAAAVLPYDPKRDCVLMVQQFRVPPFLMGDKNPWMWETPSGLVDPGEEPIEAARREAQEEAGLDVTHLDYVGALYSSSGAVGEKVHCFVGLVDVSRIEGGGGVPGEGEDIRSKVISFQELMQAVDENSFKDMPLVTTALWLARHRDRLRAMSV